MHVRGDEERPFVPLRIAVLTISDTRDESSDTSGQALIERLQTAGHALAERPSCATISTGCARSSRAGSPTRTSTRS